MNVTLQAFQQTHTFSTFHIFVSIYIFHNSNITKDNEKSLRAVTDYCGSWHQYSRKVSVFLWKYINLILNELKTLNRMTRMTESHNKTFWKRYYKIWLWIINFWTFDNWPINESLTGAIKIIIIIIIINNK